MDMVAYAKQEVKKRERERGDAQGRYLRALDEYDDPMRGMEQLQQAQRANVESAMPSLYKALQGSRENAIARGISTGDLGTTYEGDVLSSFQNNLSRALAGQTFDLFQNNSNTYLELLAGQLDRDQLAKNAKQQGKDNFWGGLMGLGGTILGGPIGGAVGGWLGSKL